MCTTRGTGEAVRRGFAGRSCGPPASSTSRSEPATAGTTTRATSASGTHPIDRVGPGRPSGAGGGGDGHLAPVGSSCELTGLDRVFGGALLAPQGVAEADQGDADRNGEQPSG